MYGSVRISLLDRAVYVAGCAARVGRWFVHLAARAGSWRPADLYAAVATARFMAAHELIDQAADAADDPETEVVQIRQPIWFGGTTIHEETH